MSDSGVQFRTAQSAPCLGADTDEVLGSVLGLSAERLGSLHAAGQAARMKVSLDLRLVLPDTARGPLPPAGG